MLVNVTFLAQEKETKEIQTHTTFVDVAFSKDAESINNGIRKGIKKYLEDRADPSGMMRDEEDFDDLADEMDEFLRIISQKIEKE